MSQKGLLLFELAGHEFGIDLGLVEEVVPANVVSQVPNAPYFFLGLSAIRGRILSVIDSAKRYDIGPALNRYFLVCKVRGNSTALTIDRPSIAGTLHLRQLSIDESNDLQKKIQVDQKFLRLAYELLEENKDKSLQATGKYFFEVEADIFVSAEMASRIGAA